MQLNHNKKRILGLTLLLSPVIWMFAFFLNYDFKATIIAIGWIVIFIIWSIAVVYLIDSPRI